MKKVVLNSEEGFGILKNDWDDLVGQSPLKSIFFTLAFQVTWWKHFGYDKSTRLLTFWDEINRLCCIFSMIQTRDEAGAFRLELLGDTDLCDHRDIIVRKGSEEEVFHNLLSHLETEKWDLIDLKSIQEDSATLSLFSTLARDFGYEVEIAEETISPILKLPLNWEDYLSSLRKKDRHEIRRKLRRADEAGRLEFEVLRGRDDIVPALDTFFSLHKMSSMEKDEFMNSERRDYFIDIINSASEMKSAILFFLKLDKKIIASLVCFSFKDILYGYNSGYDPEFNGLSPGIVLFAFVIRYSIENGYSFFDLLRGDEHYKFQLGAKPKGLYRMIIKNKT